MDGEAAVGEALAAEARGAETEPASIAWASSFAADAPRIHTPIPGPASLELLARRNRHEFGDFPWIDMLPLSFAGGAGVTLEDMDGNRLIDLTHGHMSAALGHGNPEVAEAIDVQARKLMNTRNYPTEARIELMERLAQITPGDLNLFGFFSSGTEATEAALRVARTITGGHEFLSFYGDYHGKTVGAMATGEGGTPNTGPRSSGHMTVPGGWCHRCEFKLEPSSCGLHCVDFAERAMLVNSHGRLAGIIAEPVTNGSGGRVYAPGFLKGLRDICDRHNIVLIFDEHATGLGRTGKWWAGDHEGVIPDIIIFSKFLGNGYPITSIAVSERFTAEANRSSQSSTHGGQPAACAAALAVLNILQRDKLVDHVARAGEACLNFLKGLAARHPIVGVAQGRGFLIGLEFIDPKTGAASAQMASKVAVETIRRGVVVSPVGPTMRVSPMLVTSEAVALRTLGIVEEAIADVESRL
ncbi:MAG: aminotransferase class III-fold pyridoxal phosphate-dependent enzyme [Caulobacteraceae bacterium]|nr:aminotransferase class III-fold pyridoxal phosphate-dependent enzyme [Caulobacteraceae bacterium]